MNTESIKTGLAWLETPSVFEDEKDAKTAGNIAERARKELAEIEAVLMQPANTVELPKIQHILSRDQRDALVAANILLIVMQDDRPETFDRIQGIVNEISDILYG